MSVLDRSSAATQEIIVEGQVEILGDFRRGIFGDGSRARHSGLILKTESGRLIIHLGPLVYLMKHNFQIKAGDTLKVTGVRAEQGRLPVLLAREVRNHRQRLRLRNGNGSLDGNLPGAASSIKSSPPNPQSGEILSGA